MVLIGGKLKPRCLKCIHYYSTHDPVLPRGCKLYKMKSKQFPSMLVRKESGKDCMGFELRIKKDKDKLDLSRDDLW